MIRMNDFRAEPAELRRVMLEATTRVLDSGIYVLGPEVEAFESQWASTCGVPYAVGVANGMDALEISLRSLGIGPGDEVITTTMTAFATVLSILRAGAVPVLADIDPATGLLDLGSVERCMGPRVKAVILVHLYGRMRRVREFAILCDRYGVCLLEDCAQAHTASEHGEVAGSIGVTGAFSFYPTKNLGAIGDAGIITTRDARVAKLAARLRNYGQSDRYHHPIVGMNSRLDELQAAILRERIRWLTDFTRRRRQIALAYYDGIRNSAVRLLDRPAEETAHVYHLFVLLCEQRDGLQRHLEVNGVQSLCHYPVPAHQQACAADFRRDPSGLAASELHARACLSLPCHPAMSEVDVQTVISVVNAYGAG